jgi:hypothetical protein
MVQAVRVPGYPVLYSTLVFKIDKGKITQKRITLPGQVHECHVCTGIVSTGTVPGTKKEDEHQVILDIWEKGRRGEGEGKTGQGVPEPLKVV